MILSLGQAAAVAAVVLGACASADDPPGDDAAPYVVATTSIWADVVGEVACDGAFDVRALIPAGGDPHGYEPSLRDRELLDGAAVVVTNGLGLEEALHDTLDAVAADGTPVFAVGDHVETLSVTGAATEDEDDDGDGGPDPHIWFDPARVAAALPAIGTALVRAGADRQAVDGCVADYRRELESADASVAAALADIPADRRVLVTNHDSLRYFAARYDLAVVGTVLPSATTLTEANPAALEELADAISAAGVPAIFSEELGSDDEIQTLAARLEVDVVSLYTDALGEPGSGAETYIGLLRTDARLVAAALAPGAAE